MVFLIILPFLIINLKKILKSIKSNFFILIVLSLLSITLFNTILYIGLSATTATNALLISSSVPIMILILSYFILKQNISINQGIGISLSLFGVGYLVLKGDIFNIFVLEFNKGDIWIILSSFIWALYSVLLKYKPKDLNDFEFFTTTVTLGFILLSPFYLNQNYPLDREINILKENYLIFIYISVFASIASYYFWNYGIKNIGASNTGQFTHLMPVFGTILSYIFLGERLDYYHIFGIIFIAFGLYLSLFYKTKNLSS